MSLAGRSRARTGKSGRFAPHGALADLAAVYAAKGYWAGVPLGTLLRQVAERRPDAPALVDAAAGLRAHAPRARRAHRRRRGPVAGPGHGPDERIVVQLGTGWEFVVLTLACLRAGIVPVMALPAHRRTYLARHAEATAIAFDAAARVDDRGVDHRSRPLPPYGAEECQTAAASSCPLSSKPL
ncbi:AMP-binding protein [Pseudonocardia sp. RS11V-5]|uniref:AMP-binding protein n=1 Tax=Pseudonocardia terrae TaxID=2905831 RepID=UPI001E299780|nr:AMP-binding protein [Pseudonocardia terrae]MCE3550720.1 AMP-binding protein [Pseudonocardia terrae]